MRLSRKIGLGITGILLVSFAALAALGLPSFRAYSATISDILDRADPRNRNPPPAVKAMLLNGKDFEGLENYVAMRVLTETYPTPRDLPFGRPIDQVLVYLFIDLDYSDEEIVAIYCTVAWNGEDEGLVGLSQRLYSKLPSELDQQQLAFALAVLEAPSALGNDPERLEGIAEKYSSRLVQ